MFIDDCMYFVKQTGKRQGLSRLFCKILQHFEPTGQSS